MREFAQITVNRYGIQGLYAGMTPAVVQIIPYMGLNFTLYDLLTKWADDFGVQGAGAAGFISGGLSKFAVYPLDTIKKRLQAQTLISPLSPDVPLNPLRFNGIIDCFSTIYKMEGIASFYKGLVPTVIKSMLGTGLTFSAFDLTRSALERNYDKRKFY